MELHRESPPTWGIRNAPQTPIPCSMITRALIRDLNVTTRDISLTGMLVSPVWLVLGIAAGDIVMVTVALLVALVSTLHVKPALVARLRAV
jgi:hypothetical protein